jgi:hypothetical protein
MDSAVLGLASPVMVDVKGTVLVFRQCALHSRVLSDRTIVGLKPAYAKRTACLLGVHFLTWCYIINYVATLKAIFPEWNVFNSIVTGSPFGDIGFFGWYDVRVLTECFSRSSS